MQDTINSQKLTVALTHVRKRRSNSQYDIIMQNLLENPNLASDWPDSIWQARYGLERSPTKSRNGETRNKKRKKGTGKGKREMGNERICL